MITILYASMTGNSRECAQKVAAALGRAGFVTETHDLAKYDPRSIHAASTLLLPISTWGEGEPPEDGSAFYQYIRSLKPDSLTGLNYAVFALGDTSYADFCQCGKDFDHWLEERGGRRILDRVDSDVDFIEALEIWCGEIVAALQQSGIS